MPRPAGMRRDDHARVFFIGALLAALGVCVLLFVFALISPAAEAQIVNHDAKSDIPAGKSYHRICSLTEADNIEIINRRSPNADITRYDGSQAKLYTYLLQHGHAINGNNRRVSGGYSGRLPDGERLYIVDRTGRTAVYPFWVVDGCVAQVYYQIPRALHRVILKHMKANPT